MTFRFIAPQSIGEAVEAGVAWGERGRFVAGGTDLVVQMRKSGLAPEAVIDLQRLPGLSSVTLDRGSVTIGSLVTHRVIERHEAFAGALRGLAEAAIVVGGQQVRHLGTIGGNICNASPAADLLPMLLCLDAVVDTQTRTGFQSHALESFVLGPRRTIMERGDVLTAIRFALPAPRTASVFLKAGRRRGMEISIVSVAAMLTLARDGAIRDARVAIGAAAPRPFRVTAAEALLAGTHLDEATLAAAGEAAAAAASPIDDVRASAAYRRRIVGVHVRRALAACFVRAREA